MTNARYECLCGECLMELSVVWKDKIKIEHILMLSQQCNDWNISLVDDWG